MVLSSVPKYSLREDLRSPRDVYHCLLVQKGILHSSLSQSLRAERLSFYILLRFLLYSLLTYFHTDFYFVPCRFGASFFIVLLFPLVHFCHLDFSFYPPFPSCLLLSYFFLFIFIPLFSSSLSFLFFLVFSLNTSLFLSHVLFVSLFFSS